MAASMLKLGQSTAPWLMLPSCNNTTGNRCCCFYDVAGQQFHHQVDLPGGDKTCRGSAFGWLFMVQQTPHVFLLNPLTGSQIPLPPITAFPDVLAYRPEKLRREYLLRVYPSDRSTVGQDKKYAEKHYIQRAAMSAEPGREECVVMAIRFNENYRLAFCKPNDETWTLIPHKGLFPFVDVVFWRGQFYALDHNGCLFVCDLSLPDEPKLERLLGFDLRHYRFAYHRYLVISPAGDELMMVTRDVCCSEEHLALFERDRGGVVFYNDDEEEEAVVDDIDEPDGAASHRDYWTSKFRVYKLMNEEGRRRWEEVESIGDFALFLGYNSPTFVSTKEHPGLTPNSIYFTDNVTEFHPWWSKSYSGGGDMGIYNLTTGTIQPLYSATSVHNNPLLMHPPPVWISPPNI